MLLRRLSEMRAERGSLRLALWRSLGKGTGTCNYVEGVGIPREGVTGKWAVREWSLQRALSRKVFLEAEQ